MGAKINWSELKVRLKTECQREPIALKYAAWRKLDFLDESMFEEVGEFVYRIEKDNAFKEYDSDENYWSEKAPITLGYYPYNGCKVYRQDFCYFFYLH